MLIDAGPRPARLKAERGQILPPWQSRLKVLAITAPGPGHVGGLAGLDRPADMLVIPGVRLSGSAWRTAAFEAAARGARITAVLAGQVIRAAGFTLEVLAPEPGAPGDLVGAAYLGQIGRASCRERGESW